MKSPVGLREAPGAVAPGTPFGLFGAALKSKIAEGYSAAELKADLLAGAIVGMVAIPLGMALAIASGVAPQMGLYTVVVGGAVVALLGGSRFNVTGPTAAFVVILAPIVGQYGAAGLLVAGLMAGLLLVAMGGLHLGQAIKFVPYPVVTGFTSGIAVVIATIQLKDVFGLAVPAMPDHFLDKVQALWAARDSWQPAELAVAAGTLALLLLWPRINRRIPAPLVVLVVVTIVTAVLTRIFPDLEIQTIGGRFQTVIDGVQVHGIPSTLPGLQWPWRFGGGAPLSFEMVRALFPSAVAIALLGAIESLLCASVADGMTQTKHDPNAELVALGIGNILCPFVGGIAATGAIARTATNIRFGARSPVAAVAHALFTLIAMLVLAPALASLPMAAMAALLLLVAYNMSEAKHFAHIVKVSPRGDVAVLLVCFFLTVIFDMVIGVTVGVILASLMLMRSVASMTSGRILVPAAPSSADGVPTPELLPVVPHDVLLYEIDGPLLFGAAESAIDRLGGITDHIASVIFVLRAVPVMDATGLVAMESAVQRLRNHGRRVLLVGARTQPLKLLMRSSVIGGHPEVTFHATIGEAVEAAKRAAVAGEIGA